VSPRDLAYALVFFRSLRNTNPGWEPHLLLAGTDERSALRHRSIDGIRIASPYEMMAAEKYRALLFSHDEDALVAALRPLWLEHVLDRSAGQVWLFAPKTLVAAPLEPVVAPLGAFSVALVPKLRTPSAAARAPREAGGIFHDDYVAVSRSDDASAFLGWWRERWHDERALDAVPALFGGVAIVRDRRFTAGFEDMAGEHDDFSVFALRGFDRDTPLRLGAQTRVRAAEHPWLESLLGEYGRMLTDSGHDVYRAEPYGGSHFSNGAPVDDRVRAMYREACTAGLVFDDPWNTAAHPSLYAWITSAADDAEAADRRFTRYLQAFHASRPDLVAAFPSPGGRDRAAFFRWLDADSNHGVDAHYVRQAAAPLLDAALPGVNVAGYLRSELGVGEAARAHARAIAMAGARTALVDVSAGSANRRADRSYAAFSESNPYPINLICVNADQVPWFAERVGPDFFAGKYNIGSWWWELPEFPEAWRAVLPSFQEIWVGSNFVLDALSRVAPVPVVRIPPVVDATSRSALGKAHFGLRVDTFCFAFIFDYRSVFERKNPVAVVRAFQSAFCSGERVQLVLKSINADFDPPNAALLRSYAAADPRIVVLDSYMSLEQKNALVGACDAYVSLHRSEGFGFTIAEAMALGKPVVATGWSGNMDFMTAFNSFPVEYELVRVERDAGPYRAGQRWAAPNEEHAAYQMRRVVHDEAARVRAAARGRADIRTRFSANTVARIVRDRLAVLGAVLPAAVS
jgi:glycosyltransferase involved in cell wall biosynthesis